MSDSKKINLVSPVMPTPKCEACDGRRPDHFGMKLVWDHHLCTPCVADWHTMVKAEHPKDLASSVSDFIQRQKQEAA